MVCSENQKYLGVKLKEVHLDDGMICWGMSSAKYMQEAFEECHDVDEYTWLQIPIKM